MTFSRNKPGGYATGERLPSAHATNMDRDITRALDGYAGGTYAPSAPLIINGSGLQSSMVPATGNALTNKTYVDAEVLESFETENAGRVLTALAGVNSYDFGTAANFRTDTVYGFGKNVGVLGLYTGTKIAAFPNNANLAATNHEAARAELHTLSWTEALGFEFAQNTDASVIVGYGCNTSAKAVVSQDGGITWTEVALPTTLVNPVDNIAVFYDRFDDSWYIIRETGGTYEVNRSTNDGTSWTVKSTAVLPYTGTLGALTLASASGLLFANANRGALNSTYVSSDQGATWSNAFAPSSRYVNAVTELNGTVLALGYDSSSGTKPYVATWNGSGWTQLTSKFAPYTSGTAKSVGRFVTRVGPYLVACVADSNSMTSDFAALYASKDGVEWRYLLNSTLAGAFYPDRKQNQSPGGLHVCLTSSADTVFLAPVE